MNYKQTFPTPAEHTIGTNTCEFIVLHHTATGEGTIKGVLDGLFRRADYASCHYTVDTNGDVYKIGEDKNILWHAGVSSYSVNWKSYKDLNNYSIGIETIGPLANGGFTDAQRASIGQLITELATKYGIPENKIVRHKDIAPLRKTDIADTFWNWKFKTWQEYVHSLFFKSTPIMESKYTTIKDQVLKETWFAPIFDKHEGNTPLTEQETKELIEIAFARFAQRLNW